MLTVSVVVPVYNGERYLAEALESVRQQGDTSIEILVIDDGSTDATPDIVRNWAGVRYVRQENRGPAAARNAGIALAQSDLIAFLDADDLWAPDKLRLQTHVLRDDPTLDSVSAHLQCLRLRAPMEWEAFEGARYLPMFGTLLARRAVFERVGPLDESLRCGEDVDWFMRAREAGVSMAVLEQVLLYYRLHGANLTSTLQPRQVEYARVVKKLLDRRRDRAAQGSDTSAEHEP